MKKLMRKAVWIMLGINLLGLFGCGTKQGISGPRTEPEVEGGHYTSGGHNRGEDGNAQKVIDSVDVTEFSCWFEAEDISEEIPFGRYSFEAASASETEQGKGSAVTGRYWHNDKADSLPTVEFEFTAEPGFLREIGRILKEQKLAEMNGSWEHTAGLPPDFGYYVRAEYAGGEHLYTESNVQNELQPETMQALIRLFREASGADTFFAGEELKNLYYSIYEKDVISYSACITLWPDGSVRYRIYEGTGAGNSQLKAEGETGPDVLRKVEALYREAGLNDVSTYPRGEDPRHYTLEMQFGERKEYIRSNMSLTDKQRKAVEDLKDLIESWIGI